MKPLKVPLLVVGMLAPFLLTAQSLHLIGSVPSTNSANVALTTTVSFTFDHPIPAGIVSMDSIGNYASVIPQDRISIHGLSLSSDAKTLVASVTHQADVDYTWAFYGLRATTGEVMTDFHMVTYTTSAAWSPFSVGGAMVLPDAPAGVDFSRSVVMLLKDLTFMDEENSDGPQEAMLYVAIPDRTTGAFALPGVRSGNYYVMGMMFGALSENMEPVRIGFHQDAQGRPALLSVTNAPVSGLELAMVPTDAGPSDAADVFALVDAMMTAQHPHARPLLMEGDTQDFPATGASREWMVAYFNESDSMITMVYADPYRILGMESMLLMSMPENERPPVDLATLKSIPEVFLPSKSAFNVAIANGLGNDIVAHSSMSGDTWYEMRYILSHFYFEHPEHVSAASNPYWHILFRVQSYTGYIEFNYLVDAATGVFLGRKESSGNWGGTRLELVSSSPQAMTPQVPLQTRVSFTFNEPILVESLNMNSLMQTWSVIPTDRITIHNVSYSDDYRTVFMDVTHQPETDYVWSFQGIRSTNGTGLSTAVVLNYSTRSTVSPLTLGGSLLWPEGDFIPQPSQAMAFLVLLDRPDYFLNGMQGPPNGVRNAGANLPDTWTYTMANVRPGTYFPAVFVFSNGAVYGDLLAYGFLAPSPTSTPMSITITDQSVPNLNIPVWFASNEPDHHPIDVLMVLDQVKQHVTSQGTGAELITVFGREELMRPLNPSGLSNEWTFIHFETATDTVQMIQAGSNGIMRVDRFHLSDVPEEERIPKELVKPLPSTFIGSGQAVSVALANGLADLLSSTPNEAWAQVRFSLSSFYFQYPELLTSTSPPFWDVQYNAELWDNQSNLLWQREANFLIDATNGAFINKRVTTNLEDRDAPIGIQLHQNYPNPFNPVTVVGYQLPVFGQASLKVYDVLGREVAVLVDGVMPAGSHSVVFDASDLPSGVYLYRLVAGGATLQRKLTLIR